MVLLGDERHRWRGHHVRDRRQLLRRRLRLGDEAVDHVGRRRQDEHPARDRADGVEAELEPCRDAEVAAAAADRPEEIRMGLGIRAELLPVRGHDVGRQQVVDREAVLADEIAHAAAERDPADADGAGVAETRGEAVLRRRDRVGACGQPCLGPGGAPRRRRSPARACSRGRARSRLRRRCGQRRCGRRCAQRARDRSHVRARPRVRRRRRVRAAR